MTDNFNMTPAALNALARGDFENFIAAATPGGIEAQEAAGQRTFVANSTLPKDCPREALEKLGVVFGADQDDLFVNVTLPTGWTKKATDHSMWSDLIDAKGRKRGGLFYKAAFYDRKAHMDLVRRYSVDQYSTCDVNGQTAEYGKHTHIRTVVKDSNTVVKSFGEPRLDGSHNYDLADEQAAEAKAWLNENFPQWNDVTAYWD